MDVIQNECHDTQMLGVHRNVGMNECYNSQILGCKHS